MPRSIHRCGCAGPPLTAARYTHTALRNCFSNRHNNADANAA